MKLIDGSGRRSARLRSTMTRTEAGAAKLQAIRTRSWHQYVCVRRIKSVFLRLPSDHDQERGAEGRTAVSRGGLRVLLADAPVPARDRPARRSRASALRLRLRRIEALRRRRSLRMSLPARRARQAALRRERRHRRAAAHPLHRAQRHRSHRPHRPPRLWPCARHRPAAAGSTRPSPGWSPCWRTRSCRCRPPARDAKTPLPRRTGRSRRQRSPKPASRPLRRGATVDEVRQQLRAMMRPASTARIQPHRLRPSARRGAQRPSRPSSRPRLPTRWTWISHRCGRDQRRPFLRLAARRAACARRQRRKGLPGHCGHLPVAVRRSAGDPPVPVALRCDRPRRSIVRASPAGSRRPSEAQEVPARPLPADSDPSAEIRVAG